MVWGKQNGSEGMRDASDNSPDPCSQHGASQHPPRVVSNINIENTYNLRAIAASGHEVTGLLL